MKKQGFADLAMFMDAVCWGDQESVSDKTIQYARSGFTGAATFPALLRRLANPPGGQAHGCATRMAEFALEFAQGAARREMRAIGPLFESPPESPGDRKANEPGPLSLEYLTSLNFAELTGSLEATAPFLWMVLVAAGWGKRQAKKNTHKTPHNVIMNIFSMLSYTRSNRRNRLASLWAIYLKSCGLSSRAYDALHSAGIIMSIKWTNNAYSKIADAQMSAMRKLIEARIWILSFDNCQIAKRVFSMRIENVPLFYSACAATVWMFSDSIKLPEQFFSDLRRQRREGAKEPFDLAAIIAGDSPEQQLRDKRTKARTIHHILRTLLDSAEFKSYPKDKRGDPILSSPPSVEELPIGLENVVQQFMLKTMDIDCSSYEGNRKVLIAILKQLGWDTSEKTLQLAHELMVFLAGDQLTIERLMGLSRLAHEDINGYERFDWSFAIFGWLHLVMAFANSILAQYEGTPAGYGLRRAFESMKRKGLTSVKTKGPFWHHLDEALHHVAEATILALWAEVAGLPKDADDLSKLAEKSPEELQLLAEEIYDEHVSRKALERMRRAPSSCVDEVRIRTLMFIGDVIPYIELHDAITHGDVGRMEDLLPVLLMRFAGGDNPKYTVLVLELFQGLEREWTPDAKTFVKQHCWLINREGKRDTHLPVDQGQEQNIGDIKVTYRSCGPSADIDQISSISPAIPVLRAVRDHIKWQEKLILTRGGKHTDPNKTKDVRKQMDNIRGGEWLVQTDGRTIARSEDKAADVLTAGVKSLTIDGQFARWWKNRNFARAETQIFPAAAPQAEDGDGSAGDVGMDTPPGSAGADRGQSSDEESTGSRTGKSSDEHSSGDSENESVHGSPGEGMGSQRSVSENGEQSSSESDSQPSSSSESSSSSSEGIQGTQSPSSGSSSDVSMHS
ncbi:hypothetical protein PENSPDRAFT_643534 [Peniophora sp. CONT]|nr:hypothetical protein PENSPDRAFT_643534 [Peniophora sp. CONT]